MNSDSKRVRGSGGWAVALALWGGVAGCDAAGTHPVDASDAGANDASSPDGGACVGQSAAALPATYLRINEVMSANDGAAVDELGETDDYIELLNTGRTPIDLSRVRIADDDGHSVRLPAESLAPGARVLLWADGDTAGGPHHLPFKLGQEGDSVTLLDDVCGELERVNVPALAPNEAFARFPDGSADAPIRCRYASAGKPNGQRCEPGAPTGLSDSVFFLPYAWPSPWPAQPGPLVISELSLAPNGFVELANTSANTLSLAGYTLRIAVHAPGQAMPSSSAGAGLPLPALSLAPGERVSVPVDAVAVAPILASSTGEGVVTLFSASDQGVKERLDFAALPAGTSLARDPEGPRIFSLCGTPTPGSAGECHAVDARAVPDRLRALNTPSDFAALAKGGTEVGMSAVKFVVDMQADDVVYLLSSERYALHYTFVREQIDHQPALDRCDPTQSRAFDQGWYEFSVREYFRSVGRRYLLGTLVQHASGLHTIEFAVGDAIVAAQMRRAFFAVVQRARDPQKWALRPSDDIQLAEMQKLDGQLPIVGPNAPFRDLTYQPLTRAVGFGRLSFVAASALSTAALGPQEIVITDDVPNDIPLVGGLITEAFQTPLAHVNVLSEARGTPNMALRHAHEDPRLSALLGKLIRLEVGSSDFEVREASAAEAAAFYASRAPTGPRYRAPHDETLRDVVALSGRGILDAKYIGSKAAQLAELAKVSRVRSDCPSTTLPLRLPADALAVPFAHYREHFVASGAEAALTAAMADAAFVADPSVRAAALLDVRTRMLAQPVDATLLLALESAIRMRFGDGELRFRSSSNVEDLETFNGAGLHTSSSASLAADADVSVADALRVVWASLWNERAYDEREAGHLSQEDARMGVLIHTRFASEAAQGVAISRNLFDITRSDIYYVNAQVGEAAVTNPAPAVATEQLLYTWAPRTPEFTYQSQSSLTDGAAVLSANEARGLVCALSAIHDHFRPLLDPAQENQTFAMQIEWKLDRGTRALSIKQARPQPFGHVDIPADCREL